MAAIFDNRLLSRWVFGNTTVNGTFGFVEGTKAAPIAGATFATSENDAASFAIFYPPQAFRDIAETGAVAVNANMTSTGQIADRISNGDTAIADMMSFDVGHFTDSTSNAGGFNARARFGRLETTLTDPFAAVPMRAMPNRLEKALVELGLMPDAELTEFSAALTTAYSDPKPSNEATALSSDTTMLSAETSVANAGAEPMTQAALSATNARPGDIAIIGYNTGQNLSAPSPATQDKLFFVALAGIDAGTVIHFTDRAWNGTAFIAGAGDGTFTYTAPVGGVAAGTVITITQAQLTTAGIDINDITGDAFYVYTGTANVPTTFLYAAEFADGNSTFSGSLLNTGLIAGYTAIAVQFDAGAYAGPTTHAESFLWNGSGSTLLHSIADPTNWVGDDADGQNAMEQEVQTGPWLVHADVEFWGTMGGGGLASTVSDSTFAGGSDDFNHTRQFSALVNGQVVFWFAADMVFDTVDGKFFVVDSDISGGHNRILQGNISDLIASPSGMPVLTVLYSDPSTAFGSLQRLDNLDIDLANNLIYFTHGDEVIRVTYDTPGQVGTVLFSADVAGNPAGLSNNRFNDMVINFNTGSIYLSSTRVLASASGDTVTKNFIYELTGLTPTSAANSFLFNGTNTGTARLLPFAQNDENFNPTGATFNSFNTTQDPYAWPTERGTLDGLAINPITNVLYFSTGEILQDLDGVSGGTVVYSGGVVASYALGANAANGGANAATILYQQTSQFGGTIPGLMGDLEIDASNGHLYVLDTAGVNGVNDDNHWFRMNLNGTGLIQFTQTIGDVQGTATVGLTLNHAPTLSGSAAPGAAVTEASSAPSSGETARVNLFIGVTIADVDTTTADEISSAVIRISENFQSGATHQDFLRINGTTAGTIAGSGITYSYNLTTGAMVLTGAATVAEYEAAIELVQFSTSGDDVTAFGAATTRQVAVSVSDGLTMSDEIFATVSVTGINDAPVNSGTVPTGGTEDTSRALTGFSVSDADSNPATHNIQVTLQVTHGTLDIRTDVVGGITAAMITAGADNSGTMTITATQNQINATLANATGLIFTPPANFNGNATFAMITNDLGSTGNDPGSSGTGTTEQDSDGWVVSVAAVNDAPTVAGDGTEEATAISEDQPTGGQTVSALFGGQFADAADNQTAVGGSSSNTLAGIAIVANGSSGATGQWQYFNGTTWVDIGTASQSAARTITADTAIRFNPALDYNGAAPTLTVHLIETGGAALDNTGTINLFGPGTTGGATRYSSGTVVLSQTINAVNDAPVITVTDPSVGGVEDSNLVFSTANGNAISVADVDSPSLTVNLGVAQGTLTLSQTTGLSVTGNGTGAVQLAGSAADINAALEGLIYRGALNYEGADNLTIDVSDGTATANSSVAITLTDDGVIQGTAGNDTITGTPQADYFDLSQGGSDTVSGLASSDGFYFGAALDAGDVVDAGDGADDQVGLRGNYSGGLVLAAANFVGVDTFALIAGNNTSFGDTLSNFYSYNLTTSGSFGRNIIFNANALRVGENFTFNGSAETTGSFTTYGGLGIETLTGGGGNDGFYFGPSRFNAGDTVNGGGGTDNQLGLRGDYTIDFNDAGFNSSISNIQTIALLSDLDPNFRPIGDGEFDYSITLADNMVAAGQQLTVSGVGLGAEESMSVNGSAETNGTLRLIGGGGNDVLTGGSGADIIFGGMRGDTLTGGGGNDTFVYTNVNQSNSTERDGIQDFNLGDLIDLRGIDANTFVAGDQAFNFIGNAAFSGTGAASAGQLRFENISLGGPIWLVAGDIDGDGISDFEVVLVINPADPITASDFLL